MLGAGQGLCLSKPRSALVHPLRRTALIARLKCSPTPAAKRLHKASTSPAEVQYGGRQSVLSWVELLYRRQWVMPPGYLDFRGDLRHSKCVSESWQKRKGVGCALLAAVLFGLSTPLAKSVSPLV